MKKVNYRLDPFSFLSPALIALFVSALLLTELKSQEQELKKEIHIPFPENITIEESILLEKNKAKTAIPQKTPKKFLSIPFPSDQAESKSPEIELKKVDIERPLETEKKNNTAVNAELPLEKLIVFPKIELPNHIQIEPGKVEGIIPAAKEIQSTNPSAIKEEVKSSPVIETKKTTPTEKIEVKPTNDIGKALIDKDKQGVTTLPKSTKKPSSKLDLGEYAPEETPSKPTPKDGIPKKASVKKAAEATPTASVFPVTKLPNTDSASAKKGKDKKKADESIAPFERSKYYLNRDDKSAATPELNSASSGDGENANLAKMDQIRLLALDRKKNEAKNIIEGISEPDFRFKGLYELAVGLENSAKNDKKLKEEAIPFHLAIITEAPKTNPILPKSLWALSHLLFTIGDHTPALDHLSNIILNHSSSEYADDAIYLSGRIYEESTSIRNLSRAKKYYELFLKNLDKPAFKNSIYLPFVKKRLELLEN
jgi:hypothetical protein